MTETEILTAAQRDRIVAYYPGWERLPVADAAEVVRRAQRGIIAPSVLRRLVAAEAEVEALRAQTAALEALSDAAAGRAAR